MLDNGILKTLGITNLAFFLHLYSGHINTYLWMLLQKFKWGNGQSSYIEYSKNEELCKWKLFNYYYILTYTANLDSVIT